MTWHTAESVTVNGVSGLAGWLLAGPDATVGDAVEQITESRVVPSIRLADDPESIIRAAPPIDLV